MQKRPGCAWAAQSWRAKWMEAYSLGIGIQKKPGDVGRKMWDQSQMPSNGTADATAS